MLTYNVIAGFLSGSLATLIIKYIIDAINKKVEFRRELMKLTYVRKLEKAENAIAFYYTYVTKIVELKKSFQVFIQALKKIENDDYDNDVEIIQNIINQNSAALTLLMSEKYFDINSIHLYFDLDDAEQWNENDLENMLKQLSETKSLDNDLQFWLSLYNSHNEKKEEVKAEFCWNKMFEVLPNYIEFLQKFIDSVEKNKIASQDVIKKIKEQLKRY